MARIFPINRAAAAEFERIVGPHVDRLYRFAYRLTGRREDAEDLVQDLLVRLYPKRARLSRLDEPRTWLARSLYNLYVDGVRSRQRSPVGLADHGSEALLAEMADERAIPEAHTENYLLQRRLHAALGVLNQDQRVIIALHDMEGYTLAELETILATPVGTLKSRLHRARATLKAELSEEPFAPAKRVNA